MDMLKAYFVRSGFARELNEEFELQKVSVIRIIAGLILIARWAPVSYDAYVVGKEPFLFAFVPVILSFAYCIGLFAPVVLVISHLCFYFLDDYYHIKTLGTSVFFILNIVLILTASGRRYSVDSLLLGHKFIGPLLARLYDLTSVKGGLNYGFVYMLAFVTYATVSFGALTYHLIDANWVTGKTTHIMLVNSYLSKYFAFFRELEAFGPWIMRSMSILAGIGQTVFQLFMIPLMLFSVGRRFVLIWGLLFFSISLIDIQLSYLPHIELLLWTVLFLHREAEVQIGVFEIPKQLKAMSAILLVLIVFYVPLKFPFISSKMRRISERVDGFKYTASFMSELTYLVGRDMPIVFNEVDLRMGDKWIVLYRDKDRTERVPLEGLEGERLSYAGIDWMWFSNHNSDFLYYRNTLKTRRRMIFAETFDDASEIYEYVKERALYDLSKEKRAEPGDYYYDVYTNRQSDFSVPPDERYESRLIYSGVVKMSERQ
jgi:hypothetical protein